MDSYHHPCLRLNISQVAPGLRLAKRIGPMHTAATYTNMLSMLIHVNKDLIGKARPLFVHLLIPVSKLDVK